MEHFRSAVKTMPIENCHLTGNCRVAVFLSYRKLRFHTIKMLREDAHSAQGYMVAEATAPRRENVPRHILFYYNYSSGAIRRSTHCPNFIAADCFFAYCSVTSLHTGKISSKSSRTFCTASHRCRKTPFSKWKYRLL